MKKKRARLKQHVENVLRTRCEEIANNSGLVQRPGATLPRPIRGALFVFILSKPNVLDKEAQAESKPDQIVATDLLTMKETKSEAESRLRVIRLTTRDGATGYNDHLDYGLPAEDT